ncbi:MAG TPA: hypothetical protein VGP92_13830 [Acidimicrobiia bacterium]|nr:hypothetical protein [Acidimicrobiia bacterium]
MNQSKHLTPRADAAIDAIRKAVNIQLRDVARVWGEYVYTVVDDARSQGFEIVLFEDADAADALGYHDLNAQGLPYARVFVNPILDNGGSWLRGANSVSATVSHEVCELVGDPTANHWVENARGALVAVELCDPVESCAYSIKLRDGRRVSVSDFVYPDWFNPYVAAGTQVDHIGVLRKPFEIAPDGYVIHHTDAGVRNIWGRSYPRWRKASKRKPASRTYIRHRLG